MLSKEVYFSANFPTIGTNSSFEPQNTILTLDYPVLKDISAYTGIDKIYEFIKCIRLEQIFFSKFPTGYVEGVLRGYNRFYKDMAENLCEIMLISVIGHVLAMKPLLEQKFDKFPSFHYLQ